MLDIVIYSITKFKVEDPNLSLTDQYWQLVLRHIFIDVFDNTREFLLLMIDKNQSGFGISNGINPRRDNLEEIIKKGIT